MGIFSRDKSGEVIGIDDENYSLIIDTIHNTQRLLKELNYGYREKQDINNRLSEITGRKIDDSVEVLTPFFTDFGRNIKFGKNVFININATILDRGGVEIGDNVLFAPNVSIITTNHPIDPKERRSTQSFPIKIGNNVWIGTGVIILPNVTVGENSIIGAGAVVTKDVPANVVVVGNPARIIKKIQTN